MAQLRLQRNGFVNEPAALIPSTRESSACTPRYFGSLVYLALPGSVIGFTTYLTLVGRIGPERAVYCTVLFPFVALAASTVFEGYRWSSSAVAGLLLVVIGNLVAFNVARHLPGLRRTARP